MLLLAVCLVAVVVMALPALQELARAARSAEKLFDILSRELPPTLQALRLTGLELSDLTDHLSEGVDHAGQVVKQVDQSIQGTKQQVKQAEITTRSVLAGAKAAWRALLRPTRKQRRRRRTRRSSVTVEMKPLPPSPEDWPGST